MNGENPGSVAVVDVVRVRAAFEGTIGRGAGSATAGSAFDLERGYGVLMDRSAELRYGPFAVGDTREIQGRRFRIVGVTDGVSGLEVDGQRRAADAQIRSALSAVAIGIFHHALW